MKVICPQCGKAYNIKDEQVPSEGLLVKCSACDAEFTAGGNETKPTEEVSFEITRNMDEINSSDDVLDELFDDLGNDGTFNIETNDSYAETRIDNATEVFESTVFTESPVSEKNSLKNDFSEPSETSNVNTIEDDKEFIKALFSEREDIEKPMGEKNDFSQDDILGNLEGRLSRGESSLLEEVDVAPVKIEEDDSETNSENENSASKPNSNFAQPKEFSFGDTTMSDSGNVSDNVQNNKQKLGVVMERKSYAETKKEAQKNEDVKKEEVKKGKKKVAKPSRTDQKIRKYYKRNNFLRIFVVFVLVASVGYLGYKLVYQPRMMGKTKKAEKINTVNAEVTGTLNDVRASLLMDNIVNYRKALGVLKRYMSGAEIPPRVKGLDIQVKMNLFISYNYKVEEFAKTEEELAELKQTSGSGENIDILKAEAVIALVKGDCNTVNNILKPQQEKNDDEVFYLLGKCAEKSANYEEAAKFYNTGFIHSSAGSAKLALAVASAKLKIGDIDAALAFSNKAIDINPAYVKAYVFKSDMLITVKDDSESAFTLIEDGIKKTSANAPEERAMIFAYSGSLFRKNRDYDSAAARYRNAVEIEPSNYMYVAGIADTYRDMTRFDEALKYYDQVIAKDSGNIHALMGKTETLLLQRAYDKAYVELLKIDDKKIDDPKLMIAMGDILNKLGKYDGAVKYYSKAIAMNPAIPAPYIKSVYIFYKDGKTESISDFLTKIPKEMEDSYHSHLTQGVLSLMMNNNSKALSELKTALTKNDDNDPLSSYFYGLLMFNEKKYDSSVRFFKKAYELEPSSYEFKIMLAKSYNKEKKYKETIALYKEEKEADNKDFRQMQVLAEAYFELGDYAKALTFIENAISMKSSLAELYRMQGEIYYEMKDYENAEKAVETAITYNIKDAESYILHARILIKKSDYKSAVEKIQEAAKLDSRNPYIVLLQGIIYKNLDNYEEALKNFKKIQKYPKLLRHAYREMAECYYRTKNMPEAVKYFKKAAANGDKESYNYIARIYYDDNKVELAREYFLKSISANPKDRSAYKSLAYIYKEMKEPEKAINYFNSYLKYVDDDAEKKMINDEIYFIKNGSKQ